MKRWGLVALTIFLISASVAAAQTVWLRGTGLDPSGAVIPQAAIKVSQGNRDVAEAKSDATGNFSFDLPGGEYRLTISATDFRPHQQNVRVSANMRPVSITLAVATINAVVDVGQP